MELMLAMEAGGTFVIELGVPYTDPQADGATIQLTNQVAIKVRPMGAFTSSVKIRPVVLLTPYTLTHLPF